MACFSILRRNYDVNQSSIGTGSIVDPKVLVTLGTVLTLVLADFVFGVLVSLKNGDFSASKLPKFVKTGLIPYIGGLLVLASFSNANEGLGALFFRIAATITVKFLADITSIISYLEVANYNERHLCRL